MKRKRTAPLRDALRDAEKKSKELTLALIAEWERSHKRETGIRSHNDARQSKAERDYQKYRDIAATLIAGNPQLRRATRHRLAKEVQAELRKQGRGVVSARTIWEALPKNKV
jgi:hypothetical protein